MHRNWLMKNNRNGLKTVLRWCDGTSYYDHILRISPKTVKKRIKIRAVVSCLPILKKVSLVSAALFHRRRTLSEGYAQWGEKWISPAQLGRIRRLQHSTMVAQSMGLPSCFIFSIITLIWSFFLSVTLSIVIKIVGRWLVCPLPFTLSGSTFCLSWKDAAQGDTPCSRCCPHWWRFECGSRLGGQSTGLWR